MSDSTFVLRTVRHGAVKIGGMIFRPEEHHLAYDGRLDDLRFSFGRYRDYDTGGWKPLAALWGTEQAFRELNTGQHTDGPELVDGGYPWYFWHAAAKPMSGGVAI